MRNPRRIPCLTHALTHHPQASPRLLLHGDERQPEPLFQESHQRERGFDGPRVRLDEVRLHEGEQAVVQLAGRVPGAGERAFRELHHQVGRFVRHDGHDPVGAQRNQGQGHGVVPRQHAESRRPVAQDGHDLGQVARCFLHRDDVVRLPRQSEDGRGGDVRCRATRHVVEHHRHVSHGVGDGPEVRLEPGLGGLVVVRGHDEQRVGSGGARRAGPLDRGGGGVASHAGEHLRPPSGRLDGKCDHALVLRRHEGRGFSRRSARDEQSDPSRDLPLDERAQPRLVHVAGGVERGDEGRPATAQPLQMLAHRTFLSLPGSGSSARMSSSTSAKAYTPRRPTIQRAASSAPAAKPARDRAVCTNRI